MCKASCPGIHPNYMKNNLLALFTLLLLAQNLKAQLQVAVTGGPQWSSVKEINQTPNWNTTSKPFYKSRTSLHLGLLATVPLTPQLFMQTGLFLSGKGRHYEKVNPSDIAILTDTLLFRSKFHPDYIDLPVNIGYTYSFDRKKSVRLSSGPVLSLFRKGTYATEFRSKSTNKFVKDETNLETGNGLGKIRTIDFSWNFQAMANLGKFFLTAYFSKGLTNFYKAADASQYHHQSVGMSLGIWLNKAPEVKPRDRDKDGLPDATDLCPTLPGPLATQGCPDRDADGIADVRDHCPDQAGVLKYKGCPIPDTDQDGVDNETDKCPELPGLAKYEGCPIPDSDKDGINDELDQCPNVAGSVKYNGCPVPDQDKDGINDENDRCPDIAGSPNYAGCPIPDRDGDQVDDEKDQCPDQPGTIENHGCPAIKAAIIEKINYAAKNIFFDLNSARILSRSYDALNEVVSLLTENPNLKLTINGHTDNRGTPAYNLEFSQKRANAVLEYIAAKGIARSRLAAIGVGSARPLADNKTEAGRAQNRRVEMTVTQ